MLRLIFRHQVFDVQAYPPDYFEKNTEGLDWKRVANKVISFFFKSQFKNLYIGD